MRATMSLLTNTHTVHELEESTTPPESPKIVPDDDGLASVVPVHKKPLPRHKNDLAQATTPSPPSSSTAAPIQKPSPSSHSPSKRNSVKGIIQRRKFSLHSMSSGVQNEFAMSNSARRRFSNVSDVVTRKFSNWRNVSITLEEISLQGKSLCGQYIRHRLKRSGFFNKKLGLQRLRSVIGTPIGTVVREVFPRLAVVGIELERMHPKVYLNVARQSGKPLLVNDKVVRILFVTVGKEIVHSGDLTWGKVVSIFCVAGGLGVDCVKQGRPEFLQKIVEGMEEILEDDLAHWVAQNGGWSALNTHFRPQEPDFSVAERVGIIGLLLGIVLLLAFFFKWFGKFVFL